MDSKSILAKYVQPSKVLLIVAAILLVVTVACIPMMALATSNAQQEAGDPVAFDSSASEYGDYCYIDVIGISNWLYQYEGETYYTAMDEKGYYYTVRVNDSTYDKMSAQFDWWMSEDEDEAPPAPYRLTGMAYSATSSIRENICYAWDFEESEYSEIFGTMYLNANATPGSDAIAPWLFLCLMCGITALILFLVYLPANGAFKKCVKALEEKNLLDGAANELEYPENIKVCKDQARLSRRFLFCKRNGVVVPYTDVMWVYRQNVKRYFVITVSTTLVIHTAQGQFNVLAVNGKDKKNELEPVFAAIAQGNPDVLIGYTSENQREFNVRKKAVKAG
jgi:hypothetical protein